MWCFQGHILSLSIHFKYSSVDDFQGHLCLRQAQYISVLNVCKAQQDNKAFENLVDLDKDGYVIADETCKTKTEGLYVAGDCRTKAIRQVVTAVADGGIAATNACMYLESLEKQG